MALYQQDVDWTGDMVSSWVHGQDQGWRQLLLLLIPSIPMLVEFESRASPVILSNILDVQHSNESEYCLRLVTISDTISVCFNTVEQMSRWRDVFFGIVDSLAHLEGSVPLVGSSNSKHVLGTGENLDYFIELFWKSMAYDRFVIIQSIDESHCYYRTPAGSFIMQGRSFGSHLLRGRESEDTVMVSSKSIPPDVSIREATETTANAQTRKRAYTESSGTGQVYVPAAQSKSSRWSRFFSPVLNLRKGKSDEQLRTKHTTATAGGHSQHKGSLGMKSWLRGTSKTQSFGISQEKQIGDFTEKRMRSQLDSEESGKRPFVRSNAFHRLKLSTRPAPEKLKLVNPPRLGSDSNRSSWESLQPLKSPSFDSLGLLNAHVEDFPFYPPRLPFAETTTLPQKRLSKSFSMDAMPNQSRSRRICGIYHRTPSQMPSREFSHFLARENVARGADNMPYLPSLSPDISGPGSSRMSSLESFLSLDKDLLPQTQMHSISNALYRPSVEDLKSRRRSRGPSISVVIVPPEIRSSSLDEDDGSAVETKFGRKHRQLNIEQLIFDTSDSMSKKDTLNDLQRSSLNLLDSEKTPNDSFYDFYDNEDRKEEYQMLNRRSKLPAHSFHAGHLRSSTVQGIRNEQLIVGTSSISRPSRNRTVPAEQSRTSIADKRKDFDQSFNVPKDLTGEVRRCTNYATDHGGFADVYLGDWYRDSGVVKVAIKVLRPKLFDDSEADKKVKRRLRRELRVWQHLRHRHVLELCGTCSNFGPYEAMISPWLANGNVSRYLKRRIPIADTRFRLKLLCEAAEGLQYLHSISPPVIHGDLTGSNILVNDNEEACICDFGLSSVIEVAGGLSITNTSTFAGNVRWMAPELFVNTDIHGNPTELSVRTDVYSFGCVALEILTGRIPFYHIKNDAQVVIEISRGAKLHNPEEDGIRATDEQWDYIRICCADDPETRPTMPEVVERFRHFRDEAGHDDK